MKAPSGCMGFKGFSILFLLALVGCKKGAQPPVENSEVIKIGEVETLTGAEATYGIAIHRGITLAIDQANAEGGINGKKIEVTTLDDQGKSEESALAATKLVKQTGVLALIGAVTSSRSMAMAPIATHFKVPMLTPTATHPKVTQLGEGIFRTCFVDAFQGKVMAKFALDSLKAKNASIVRDIKSDYSVGLAEVFAKVFKEGGGQILSEQSFSSGDIDYKAQLTEIRAKKPDVIFIPAYYSDASLIIRQARDLGIQIPLLGTDGWDSARLVEVAGKATENSYFSNHYSNENQEPEVQKFVTRFREKFGVTPDGIAALGYDTAGLMMDAIRRTKSLTSADLQQALAATREFKGVTGKLSMDQNRNPIKSAVILKWVNQKQVFQSLVQP